MKKLILLIVVSFLRFAPLLAHDATQEGSPMFDYDQSAPLNVQEVSSERRGDVTVKDITYHSPTRDQPLSAYLVAPPGDGPFPGILYAHWYEPSSTSSNRTEFLDEAVIMAQEYGVVSLLIKTMWSDPNWYRQGRSLDSDYDDAIRQVIELRRGLDVLTAQPQIDAGRIAYVGHDFGAMYGTLMSAEDKRAKANVFIAGASNFNQWMLFGVPEDQPGLADYKAKMETLAPARFVAQNTPAAILFQFGSEDFYTPQEDYLAFYNAASSPKQLQVYESEHAMESDEIRANRITFLGKRLGLREP